MSKTVKSLLIAALLAAPLLLSACGGGAGTQTKVRIGEVTRSIFYAPQYVAISQGFFKDEGLAVELTTTAGGDKTMTALLTNGIDVALVGSETSIYVGQQGASDPAINFAQLTQTDGTFLVARQRLEKFDWQLLKGKTFLGQRKGGMPQMAGEYALKQKGIDPHRDTKLIQNVDFANIPAAFSSGTGDFVQLFEPQATMIEREGRGYVVASFGVESGRLPYTAYMAKKSWITRNPQTAQKFTNAIYKAQLWVQQQPVERIAEAVAPFFPDTDRAVVEAVVKRYKEQESFATDPIIDEAEWNRLQDVMEMAGELKQRADYSKLVDNSYAEKAIGTIGR